MPGRRHVHRAMKPRTIGRYQVKAELNRGGMSVVYLAHDPRMGRDVAIKMLPRSLQDQPAVRARFEREARVIAALEHPAIVPIYDFSDEEGQPYLVMRYMPGGSLTDVLTYGRLNLTDAARIVQRLAGALDEAHRHKIIHRDLKPGNILFDNHGEAFLSDFGIVKLYEGDSNLQTLTGSVVLGTPAYMSPEQALGKAIDQRSDVYSLGAVLYEMLTGLPPYKGPTSISVAMKHVVEPVPDPRQYRPQLPEACAAVLTRAMAKEPQDRFATAGEMAAAFSQVVAGAASQEPMMPPIVVRKKPQTTSGAAQLQDVARESSGTTEWAPGAPAASQETADVGRGRRWMLGVAAALVLLFLAVSIGVFVFAVSQRMGDATLPPVTIAPPSPTLFATSPVVPTRPAPGPGGELDATPPIALPGASPTAIEAPEETPQAPPQQLSTPRPPSAVQLIVAQPANVREGPSTAMRILARLAAGTELIALKIARQSDGDWYRVRLDDGREGYVFADLVQAVNPEAIGSLPTEVVVIIAPTVPPPKPTPTPEETPTPDVTPTPTVTPTETPAPSPTPTVTPVPLPAVPTSPPTATPTPATTPTPTAMPTPTPTATPTV